jgi:hypothetical protein
LRDEPQAIIPVSTIGTSNARSQVTRETSDAAKSAASTTVAAPPTAPTPRVATASRHIIRRGRASVTLHSRGRMLTESP